MRFTCTNFTSQNNTLFVDQWNAQAQKTRITIQINDPWHCSAITTSLPQQQTAYNCITLLNRQHDTKRHGKPFKRYRTANNLSAINSRRAEELSQFAYFSWERASEMLVLSDRRHKQKWNSFRIYDLARLRWHDIFTPVGGSDGWVGRVGGRCGCCCFDVLILPTSPTTQQRTNSERDATLAAVDEMSPIHNFSTTTISLSLRQRIRASTRDRNQSVSRHS